MSQMGSFQQLNANEGYVRDLSVQQQPSDSEAILMLDGVRGQNLKLTLPNSTRKSRTPKIQAVKTRDKATYRFYLKPIGLFRVLILLMAVVSLAFLTRFQRKCS